MRLGEDSEGLWRQGEIAVGFDFQRPLFTSVLMTLLTHFSMSTTMLHCRRQGRIGIRAGRWHFMANWECRKFPPLISCHNEMWDQWNIEEQAL